MITKSSSQTQSLLIFVTDQSGPFPHLWWLDEKTGRWVDAGELKRNQELTQRPKRQTGSGTFSGTIPAQNLQLTLTIDKTQLRCLAKVKADADGEGIEGAKVTRIFVNRGNQVFLAYQKVQTNSDGYACIYTYCDGIGYL